MQPPRAIMFDLDDTLAESFKPPSAEVLGGLRRLLEYVPVAIITGAGFQRMQEQFLSELTSSAHADRLFIFPNSSAQSYQYENGEWKEVYSFLLTDGERALIKKTIAEVVAGTDILKNVPHYGQQLFDREAQVAYTPVGSDASSEFKRNWDADGTKRRRFWKELKRRLPEFEILMGGRATIDITKKGVNKAHGVEWFSDHLGVPVSEMLYVGDALYEGGNDAVVIPTGINIRPVAGPEETPHIIDELLAAYET
jgi:phosphomannomutase